MFLAAFLIFVSIGYFNYFIIHPFIGVFSSVTEMSLKQALFENLFLFGIISLCSVSYFHNRTIKQKLKEQLSREKELLVKELFLIKNQLNSTLTNNFLNYCQKELKGYSIEASDAVGIYAEMMLYNRNTDSGKMVQLQKEIQYIVNFIKLQSLLSNKVCVNCNFDVKTGDVLILPRILICFVENAFKHGVINNSEYPIQINLNTPEGHIVFSVKNKINHNKRYRSTKVGKENVEQLLKIVYNKNFKLNTSSENDEYYAELRLKIA
jgi:LytS/YehU family sensor histidine kinase